MDDELWKPCAGHPGYEVSNQGGVQRSALYDSAGRKQSDARPMPQCFTGPEGKQYWTVSLSDFGKPRQSWTKRRVHLLVLETFVGPRPHGMFGCHNDGDKDNNRLENLRWDTASNNSYDTVRHGRHHQTKKTECLNGHDITNPENTYPNAIGRRCKICNWARAKAFRMGIADYRELLV